MIVVIAYTIQGGPKSSDKREERHQEEKGEWAKREGNLLEAVQGALPPKMKQKNGRQR
jgi:hypothetical protein